MRMGLCEGGELGLADPGCVRSSAGSGCQDLKKLFCERCNTPTLVSLGPHVLCDTFDRVTISSKLNPIPKHFKHSY